MHIAILCFEGFNELDSLIAFGLLNRVKQPGWRVSIASNAARIRSMNGLVIEPQATLAEANTADAVLIGSGMRTRELAADATAKDFASDAFAHCKFIGMTPEAEAIFAWLADYRPQPFPGPIDRAAAERGAGLYARGCASCHGSFDWNAGAPQLTSYPDWIGDVGTDPLRGKVLDQPLAAAIRKSRYGSAISVKPGEGYAAPPLAGVWASAPYLHNGSVPSLAALLDPRQRPRRHRQPAARGAAGHGRHRRRIQPSARRRERRGTGPAGRSVGAVRRHHRHRLCRRRHRVHHPQPQQR